MNTFSSEVASYHFDIKEDLLIARWPFWVRAESPEFLDSLLVLFQLIKEKSIRKLLLDSGTPDGGSLTEAVIAFIEQEVFQACPLQKVALLESTDFHWDNNLIQFINYLKTTFALEVGFQTFSCPEDALNWLQEDRSGPT